VIEPVLPDREQRPGGRWSRPRLVGDLLRLATIERAVAHVTVGWVAKVADLDDKLGLAATIEDVLGRAIALRHHAVTLLERDDAALLVRPAWCAPLQAIDASADAATMLVGLDEVRSFLLARYRELSAAIDPLFDARLAKTVRGALESLTPAVGDVVRPSAALAAAWDDDASALVPIDNALWGPLDRVPFPARPPGRPRPEAGARGHMISCSRLEDSDIAGELNDNVMAELCALELLCRCSYEHPDLPWSSHIAMARHATDEERHAQIFRRLLAQRGYTEEHLPQHGCNYEHGYEFPECEVGGKRELVWRLLILCTVLEGLAIDKLPVEIGVRDVLAQSDFARALDYIATDELFHVENGLRLTRRLCAEHGFDPILDRERVHGRFFGRQRDVRLAYLERDPVRAAREIAILEGPDPDGIPFKSRTEGALRRRASFTDDELRQIDRWGYNEGTDGSFVPA
jgi:hypothetical protein